MSVQSISQLLDKCIFLLNPICFPNSVQLVLEQPCFEKATQLRWMLVLALTSQGTPILFSLPRIPKKEIHGDKGAAVCSHGSGNKFCLSQKVLPRWSMVKSLPASAVDTGDVDSIPGSGRSPGGENGNPFQHSCLEDLMNRGAWRAAVLRTAKSQTQLSSWARGRLVHWGGLLVLWLRDVCTRYSDRSLPLSRLCPCFFCWALRRKKDTKVVYGQSHISALVKTRTRDSRFVSPHVLNTFSLVWAFVFLENSNCLEDELNVFA